jgi:hypothetical protein
VADRADLLTATTLPESVVATPVVWDPVGQDYLVTMTAPYTTTRFQVVVSVGQAFAGTWQTVPAWFQFVNGPAVRLDTTWWSLSESAVCQTDWLAEAHLSDQIGNLVVDPRIAVRFSVTDQAQTTFLTDPRVDSPHGDLLDWPVVGRYPVQGRTSGPGDVVVTAATTDGELRSEFTVTTPEDPLDPQASRVSFTEGPRVPDGTDAHTVTVDLVSTCGVPVADLASLGTWLEVGLIDAVTADPVDWATASQPVPDPDRPGRYTAQVMARQPGAVTVQVEYGRWVTAPPDDQWVEELTPLFPEGRLVFATPVVVPPPVVRPSNGALIGGQAVPEAIVQVVDEAGLAVPGCTDVPVDNAGWFSCRPPTRLGDGRRLWVSAVVGTVASTAVELVVSGPVLGVDPAPASVGAPVVVAGRGFVPGESVTLTLTAGGRVVGSATADDTGALAFESFAAPQPGRYALQATGEVTGLVEATWEVTGGAVVPGGGLGPAGQVAWAARLVASMAGLVTAGALMVLGLGRRVRAGR